MLDNLEVLDLTKRLFKKYAIFLECLSEYNECSITDFAAKSKIQYKYLLQITDYFEKRDIVTRYQPDNITDKRCVYIALTPRGKDLCKALLDFTHVMKYGTKFKEPHFGDHGKPGVIILNFKDLRNEIGRRRRIKH